MFTKNQDWTKYYKNMYILKITNAKSFILNNIDLILFTFVAAWSLVAANRLNRFYQDSWVLEDIWIYLVILVSIYIFSVNYRSDLQQIAILSSVLLFLINILPALKYTYPYLSTTDVAMHTSFARSIASTGQLITEEGYASTPGFHVLLAVISNLTGMDIIILSKIQPALLGSLIPLAFYMFCKRALLSPNLAKWIVVISSLSLPILYTLNGTSFAIPVFICLLVFVILRAVTPEENQFQFSILALLLIVQILFWHPSTSLISPFFFICIGIFQLLFPQQRTLPPGSRIFLTLGIISIVSTLTYWMYDAHYVWDKFLDNLMRVVISDPSPNLIPVRFFEISFFDKVIITLLYHSRDGILLFLAIVGIFLLLVSRRVDRNSLNVKFFVPICIVSIGLLIGIFVIDFSAQGYKRFLFYSVAIAPVFAGYSIWKGIEALKKYLPLSEKAISSIVLMFITLFSLFQLFPYQNLISIDYSNQQGGNGSPVLWLHQVNTGYQYRMLEFVNSQLNKDQIVLLDYIGIRQEKMFFEPNSIHRNIRIWFNIKPEPAFIALHWPGIAGAYNEKVEFRSTEQINLWRNYKGMNTIYDNGGAFILFYPSNALEIKLKTR